MKHFSIIICTAFLLVSSCKKGNSSKTNTNGIPVINMNASFVLSDTVLACSAQITDSGGTPITDQGMYWSDVNTTPGSSDNVIHFHYTGWPFYFGDYFYDMVPGTDYYFRAFATNAHGTGYSAVKKLTTTGTRPSTTVPVVTTYNTDWSGTSDWVYVGGTVVEEGGASVTSRGVCWDTFPHPSLANHVISSGSGTGDFYETLDHLVIGKTYYVRAYATNSFGTAYGNEIQGVFSRSYPPPTVYTISVTDITSTTAVCHGYTTVPIAWYGAYWATHTSPSMGDFTGSASGGSYNNYTVSLTGLTPNTTYYVRASAINSNGSGFGNSIMFTTLP